MKARPSIALLLAAAVLAPGVPKARADEAPPRASGRLIELLDAAFAGADAALRAHQAAPTAATGEASPQTPPGADVSGPETYGYWAVNEGADGVKVGVVFPAYSPTEYVGAVFYCIPNSGVRITLDSAKQLPAGSKAEVAISVGDVTARYSGVAQDKATEDGGAVVVETSFSDPIFEELAAGKPFSFVIAGEKAALPTRNGQKAFARFLERCRN